jgi:hypothetical protein
MNRQEGEARIRQAIRHVQVDRRCDLLRRGLCADCQYMDAKGVCCRGVLMEGDILS